MSACRIVLFLLFLSFFSNSMGQRTFYFGVLADGGMPINSFSANRDVLRSKIKSYHTQFGVSLGMIFAERIGLEIGVAQNVQSLALRDKNFTSRHQGFEVDLRSKNHFLSYFGNIQYQQPLSFKTSMYFQIGYAINQVGGGDFTQTREFAIDNEFVHASSKFNSRTEAIIPEIGFQNKLGEKALLSYGIKLNIGRSNLLEGNYLVENNGVPMEKDTYNSKGSYLGFKVKFAYIIDQTYKKEKKPKRPKTDPVVVIPPPADTAKPKTTEPPKELEGREVQVTHKVEVKSKKVILKVWDHQQVDGDRISLNLDGRWVLINYTLQKKQREIEVELKEGENYLVLHALNLGKYHPNTAAIIIDDGVQENKIVLESTLESSGTIEIKFNPN